MGRPFLLPENVGSQGKHCIIKSLSDPGIRIWRSGSLFASWFVIIARSTEMQVWLQSQAKGASTVLQEGFPLLVTMPRIVVDSL